VTPARARLSPWTRAGIDLLADGPRPKREVLAAAARQVPPGHAIRTHNRFRNNPKKLSIEHIISVGSYWVVRKNFYSMVGRGSLVEFEQDGEIYWRLSDKAQRLLTV
jgi:hypothetical protein